MEPVSLALGAIGIIEVVRKTYSGAKKLVQDSKHFQGDRINVITRISVEEEITTKLETLLFSKASSDDALSYYDTLDDGVKTSIDLLLYEFANAINGYFGLEQKYALSRLPKNTKPSPAGASTKSEGSSQQADTLPVRGTTISRFGALRWARRDKKRIENLHTEFEMYNLKISRLVESCILAEQRSAGRSAQSSLFGKPELHDLGIEAALKAQRKALPAISTGSPAAAPVEIKDHKLPIAQLKQPFDLAGIRPSQRAKVSNSNVIFDVRKYKGTSGVQAERVNMLASILQDLHKMEPMVPECLGWAERTARGDWGLIFRIPDELSPEPVTLYESLPKNSGNTGPLLHERMQIAYQLASTVSRLHSVSWVHKNLRSDAILLYYPKSGKADHHDRVLPPHWYLHGFEYARSLDVQSSLHADPDVGRNVYRHPERWGVPTDTFSPIHDRYALGVILLELGMWRRAESLLEAGQTNPNRVREALRTRAKDHLGYFVGSAYRDVVLRCLQDPSQATAGEASAGGRSQANSSDFMAAMVDELRVLAYPDVVASHQIRLLDEWEGEDGEEEQVQDKEAAKSEVQA